MKLLGTSVVVTTSLAARGKRGYPRRTSISPHICVASAVLFLLGVLTVVIVEFNRGDVSLSVKRPSTTAK